MGELSALITAGALSVRDGLTIATTLDKAGHAHPAQAGQRLHIQQPARFVQNALRSAGLDTQGTRIVASVTGQTTLVEAPEEALKTLEEQDQLTIIEREECAIPSWRTDSAVLRDALTEALSAVTFKRPHMHVLSQTTGRPAEGNAETVNQWIKLATTRTRFAEAITSEAHNGLNVILDYSASAILHHGARSLLEQEKEASLTLCLSFAQASNTSQVTDIVAQLWQIGAPISWSHWHQGRMGHKIALPLYPFEHKAYWLPGAAESFSPAHTQPEHTQEAAPISDTSSEGRKQHLLAIIARIKGMSASDIGLDDHFQDVLGFDSMTIMELQAQVSREMAGDKTISMQTMMETVTPQKLLDFLESS